MLLLKARKSLCIGDVMALVVDVFFDMWLKFYKIAMLSLEQ
jgi:hypothetical protein